MTATQCHIHYIHELDTWSFRKSRSPKFPETILQQKRSCLHWSCGISSAKMTGDVRRATIPFSSAALRGGQLLYLVLLVTWICGACGSCARSGSSGINGKCSTTWVSPVVSDYGWPLSIGEPQHQLRGSALNVFYVNCFGGLGPQRLLSQLRHVQLLRLQLRKQQEVIDSKNPMTSAKCHVWCLDGHDMTVDGWNPWFSGFSWPCCTGGTESWLLGVWLAFGKNEANNEGMEHL